MAIRPPMMTMPRRGSASAWAWRFVLAFVVAVAMRLEQDGAQGPG